MLKTYRIKNKHSLKGAFFALHKAFKEERGDITILYRHTATLQQIKYWYVLVRIFAMIAYRESAHKLTSKQLKAAAELLKLHIGYYDIYEIAGNRIVSIKSIKDVKSKQDMIDVLNKAREFIQGKLGVNIFTADEYHELMRNHTKKQTNFKLNDFYLDVVKSMPIQDLTVNVTMS